MAGALRGSHRGSQDPLEDLKTSTTSDFYRIQGQNIIVAVSTLSPFRLGVLGSGKGSNFLALCEAIDAGLLPAQMAVVISDVPDAGILKHAEHRGIPAHHLAPGKFRTKLDEEAEAIYLKTLKEAHVDLVVLAGFMRILKGDFLRSFEGRVVNIHPSLLPSFPGLAAWKQALDYGVKVTGCTVHYVDQGVDTGPILGQRAVPVLTGDTAESLHARIQQAERELFPAVVASIARGEIKVQGRLTSGFEGEHV